MFVKFFLIQQHTGAYFVVSYPCAVRASVPLRAAQPMVTRVPLILLLLYYTHRNLAPLRTGATVYLIMYTTAPPGSHARLLCVAFSQKRTDPYQVAFIRPLRYHILPSIEIVRTRYHILVSYLSSTHHTTNSLCTSYHIPLLISYTRSTGTLVYQDPIYPIHPTV